MDNKTYIGTVEDNQDPKKLGRVKVKVMNVYDKLKTADIPWATPWKDLNGNSFNVPDKGKMVIVVFDQGDKNKPEYIFSDHYNANLEKKLLSLSDPDYLSMKSLIFDHRTQIYVNEAEGLKIDHKYNNVNITENTIDINLKDNNRSLNLGDAQASQQAILGNHWMDWFDEFVDNLLGSKSGPFLGNLGAPVIPNPAFISCLQKYKALRDPVFLSHHVNIVDNNKATSVSKVKREDNPQIGDSWQGTKQQNNVTTKTDEDFKPVEGPKKTHDDTPPKKEEPTQPTADNKTPGVNGTTASTATATEQEKPVVPEAIPKSSIKSDPLLEKLFKFLESKKYKLYEDPNVLNMVALRGKDDGVITNKFDEQLHVFYKKEDGNWQLNTYDITTLPGFIPQSLTASEPPRLPQYVPLLSLGQYEDSLIISQYEGDPEHECLEFEDAGLIINSDVNKYVYTTTPEILSTTGNKRKLYIKRGNKLGSSETVFNFSPDGSQCFKSINQWQEFFRLCQAQSLTKSRFTYTISRKSDFEKFTPEPEPQPTTPSGQPENVNYAELQKNIRAELEGTGIKFKIEGSFTELIFADNNTTCRYTSSDKLLITQKSPYRKWKGTFSKGGKQCTVIVLSGRGEFSGNSIVEVIDKIKKEA